MATRILLADDSITIQKVVNLTFADEGIEVVAVSNGDLAERRLAEVAPDLVLADIFMPGKNGYELCESIKENPQFRNVPVVLLVGAFEPFDCLLVLMASLKDQSQLIMCFSVPRINCGFFHRAPKTLPLSQGKAYVANVAAEHRPAVIEQKR